MDATVVKNKIVYFGSYSEEATYVLKRKKHSDELEVADKFDGIEYERGGSHSSFCTFKDKIYYFPLDKFTTVSCLDVDERKSSVYFWFFWFN